MPIRVLAVACAILAFASSVEARPSTFAMTCGDAVALVASAGAVVMNTGQYTFERFVSHRGYCQFNEYVEQFWAPTLDNPQCLVGYICKSRPAPWEFDF